MVSASHWLVKSEPFKWSWDMQVKKGVQGWDGVRNYQASNNMKAMKTGDLAFFYHSNEGKEIVGIVEVVEEYHPDPTDESGKFGMVSFKAVKPLKKLSPSPRSRIHRSLKTWRCSNNRACPSPLSRKKNGISSLNYRMRSDRLVLATMKGPFRCHPIPFRCSRQL